MAFRIVGALLVTSPCGVVGSLGSQYDEPNSLLQTKLSGAMHERANRKEPLVLLQQADAAIAQRLRQRRHDPAELATAITKGIQGVIEATNLFVQKKFTLGVSKLGDALLEAVDGPISREYADRKDEWDLFKNQWQKVFRTLPDQVASFKEKCLKYQESGSPAELINIINEIFQIVDDSLLRQLPTRETLTEVMKIMDAIQGVLDSLADGWQGFEDGNVEESISTMFTGLRAALDIALPEELQNDATYQTIMSTIDHAMSSLTKHIQDYKKLIAESSVCYKKYKSRPWRLPTECEEGYQYAKGTHYCLKEGEGEDLIQVAETGLVEKASGGKMPKHAVPAGCKENGKYTFHVGRYCYIDECPGDTVPTPAQNRCMSRCQGEFPTDGKGMCGKAAGDVETAIANMITAVVTQSVNLGLKINEVAQDEHVNPTSIVDTVNAFVDMGKPFAKPQCSF